MIKTINKKLLKAKRNKELLQQHFVKDLDGFLKPNATWVFPCGIIGFKYNKNINKNVAISIANRRKNIYGKKLL